MTTTIQPAIVIRNEPLCREHYRLTLRAESFAPGEPGQFVNIGPESTRAPGCQEIDWNDRSALDSWAAEASLPTLRRAFSIAGLRRSPAGVEIDVIYRVVGTATRWMEALRGGDIISVLGPLGNVFPISARKRVAWLVAGGVGLPPMLWLAEVLRSADRETIAFCGARTRDLLPLALDPVIQPAGDASVASACVAEFAGSGTRTVLSTDDGSLGYHGYIGDALAAYHRANPTASDRVVAYTCGPEPMMRFVAWYCHMRGIECYACTEAAMACGIGTCQSCVIPVRDDRAAAGWRYKLCCKDGPVFPAEELIWDPVETGPPSR
ncbi:MAG: dihydroorotate dehydrogenase electron transfer subunit [Planctomycetes bacterium]|nr:dihydroorotate dehydrogenase electron transfer subunit [Planctomycetota bacterium]